MDKKIKIAIIILAIALIGFGIYEVTKPKSSGTSSSGTSSSGTSSLGTSSSGTSSLGTDANGGTTLMQGQYLTQGGQLVSIIANYAVHFAGANDPNGQPQGQIYTANTTGTAGFPFFAKNVVNPNNIYLKIDNDGFLKCYDNNMQVILKVNKYPGNKLLIQTDGNLVLYNNNHTAVWASGAYGNAPIGDIPPS